MSNPHRVTVTLAEPDEDGWRSSPAVDFTCDAAEDAECRTYGVAEYDQHVARLTLEAAAPLIAAKALRDAASEYAPGLVDRGYMKRYLTSRADHIERGES